MFSQVNTGAGTSVRTFIDWNDAVAALTPVAGREAAQAAVRTSAFTSKGAQVVTGVAGVYGRTWITSDGCHAVEVGPAALVCEARGWIADCWPADEVGSLTDAQVIAGVNRHYAGGWRAFVADSRPFVSEAP